MSGGSRDYICYKIENELVGAMRDRELDDLMKDVAELAHDLEWAECSDISWNDYYLAVSKFKEKWLSSKRDTRLKKYVDEAIKGLRVELYRLIGKGGDNS